MQPSATGWQRISLIAGEITQNQALCWVVGEVTQVALTPN